VGEAGPTSGVRDRREDGRPEQARPRDRTGRPLPYGTTGVLTAETLEPDDVGDAIRLGVRRWSERRFFEAHELLEHAWKAAGPDDRERWKGVIQLAVAGVHLQRGNADGARALLLRGLRRLEAAPSDWQGFDIGGLRTRAAALLARLDGPDGQRESRLPEPDLGELIT
jgi:hypothetical protein